jgi:6-phosphogluconolactonase
LGANTESVATDPMGQFVYAAQIITGVLGLTFNSTTDAFTLLSDSACSSNPISVAVDPSGKFAYAANPAPNNTVDACAIDQTTGNLNPISGESKIPAGTNPLSVVTTAMIH